MIGALTALANPGAAAHRPESPKVMGIYFDDPVTMTPPGDTPPKIKALCGTGTQTCSPVSGSTLILNTFEGMANNGLGAVDYQTESDVLVTVWLSANVAEG